MYTSYAGCRHVLIHVFLGQLCLLLTIHYTTVIIVKVYAFAILTLVK